MGLLYHANIFTCMGNDEIYTIYPMGIVFDYYMHRFSTHINVCKNNSIKTSIDTNIYNHLAIEVPIYNDLPIEVPIYNLLVIEDHQIFDDIAL